MVAEDAGLRESEDRFRKVFEEGPIAMALVGRDFRLTKVNGALCRMLDYTEAELIGLTFPDISHADDVETDRGEPRASARPPPLEATRGQSHDRAQEGHDLPRPIQALGIDG